MPSVIAMRTSTPIIAVTVGLIVLLPVRVSAQWWSRAPTDFEGCADTAEKAANKEEKTAALAECNAKFAGRRKPGGNGYTYYDFMQDRTFDIAGPNPTPEEQKSIDQQYTVYLEGQRRSSIAAAAVAARQREQDLQPPPQQPVPPPTVQQVSLKSDVARVPMPVRRPTEQQQAAYDSRLRAAECAKHTFSCEWPKLSEGLNGLKKIFGATPAPVPAKDKRS
jgi:hypothetical protein